MPHTHANLLAYFPHLHQMDIQIKATEIIIYIEYNNQPRMTIILEYQPLFLALLSTFLSVNLQALYIPMYMVLFYLIIVCELIFIYLFYNYSHNQWQITKWTSDSIHDLSLLNKHPKVRPCSYQILKNKHRHEHINTYSHICRYMLFHEIEATNNR